jgi:hypothetical protein
VARRRGEGLTALNAPDFEAKLCGAFERLLLLEKDLRPSLVTILPDLADAIR